MNRKRALSWAGGLLLALTLLVAPCVWAADAPATGPESLWTSIEAWFHGALLDWFGVSGTNTDPEVTYSGTDDTTEPIPPPEPMSVGPGGPGTTDAGEVSDPDG